MLMFTHLIDGTQWHFTFCTVLLGLGVFACYLLYAALSLSGGISLADMTHTTCETKFVLIIHP